MQEIGPLDEEKATSRSSQAAGYGSEEKASRGC